MSAPALPARNPPSGGRGGIPNKPGPPVPAPRVSASIAKRWPPLQEEGGDGPALPKRPPEPVPRTPPHTDTAPSLPKRPAEPLPSTPQDTPPSLPKRPPEMSTPESRPRRSSEKSATSEKSPTPPVGKRANSTDSPLTSSKESTATPSHPGSSRGRQESIVSSLLANGGAKPSGDTFGTCLQGATDYINRRHDDELIALESLRFHIFNKAKQDKSYAEELLKTNTRAFKKFNSVSDSTSPIFQAWLKFLEMSESIQKQVSNGAAQMSSVLLSKVDQLIRDKRGAKTVFDRERIKIDKEKSESCTRVTDLKTSYRHYTKKTQTMRDKLEAALAKDPPKPQEQDKSRKKFVGSADKLHSTHNDYCLSILNANRHMDHHRDSLAPFNLDTLQQRMELQIGQWKEAMTNYAKAVDLTQTYQETYQVLYESLEAIDQSTEYTAFIQEHKEEEPPLYYYIFDGELLNSPVSPQVEPGKVVVNNLTHNSMKARLAALEDDLEQYSRDVQTKADELKELMADTASETSSLVSSPPPPSPAKESGQQAPVHIRIATVSASIRELECIQARKQDQAALIKESVDAMSGDTAPLFDQLGEGVDLSEIAAANAAESAGDGASVGSRRGTSQWGTTLSRGMKGLKGFFKGGKKSRTKSTTVCEDTPTMVPSVSHDTIASSEGGGDESDVSSDTYDEPPETPVEDEEWYFGEIDRRLAENKVKVEGDFLVRYSERQKKYVLTCKYKGVAKHFVIQVITDDQTGQKQFRFESRAFSKIRLLLEHHRSSGTPVTRASGAIIIKPISRFDKWELQKEEIKIGKKIGKGAFGDVFEAMFLRENKKVAVKTCRSSDVYDMEKFLQEADILKGYQHPNIVSLIGVCTQKDQVYIVMEFMPGGSLLDFLRKKGSHQTKKKLCAMVIDASKGMVYLEDQHCIHRDLAARNCLVGDEDIVKIADFGMSRESEDSEYTVQSGTRAIPIKWTAPEALNYGKYTPASDIWSFGVMLWEAFSCGSAPYPGMNNQDARTEIENGYRMSSPADCPPEVYAVMLQCWQYDPEERPDFKTVYDMLTQSYDKIKT